jgi:hypothetical protein
MGIGASKRNLQCIQQNNNRNYAHSGTESLQDTKQTSSK